MSRHDWGQRHPGIERQDDEQEWQGCADTVNTGLAVRARLWDDMLTAVKNRSDG